VQEVAKNLPIESFFFETDCPYLTPTPFRGKRNEPSYLEKVVDRLAQIYSCSPEEIATATAINAESLFR
jgi:TatD DNase family protein